MRVHPLDRDLLEGLATSSGPPSPDPAVAACWGRRPLPSEFDDYRFVSHPRSVSSFPSTLHNHHKPYHPILYSRTPLTLQKPPPPQLTPSPPRRNRQDGLHPQPRQLPPRSDEGDGDQLSFDQLEHRRAQENPPLSRGPPTESRISNQAAARRNDWRGLAALRPQSRLASTQNHQPEGGTGARARGEGTSGIQREAAVLGRPQEARSSQATFTRSTPIPIPRPRTERDRFPGP